MFRVASRSGAEAEGEDAGPGCGVLSVGSLVHDPSVSILFEIGLLIFVSSLASELSKRVRLPGMIGAILVGLFIGGPFTHGGGSVTLWVCPAEWNPGVGEV